MSLAQGDLAPDFELPDQHGQPVRLSSFAGERSVVLVFYPYAFSGVCTGELAALQANLDRLVTEDLQLLAISCDPKHSLRALADRDGLHFPLLSDFWPHGEVSSAYGAFNEQRGCPTRSTFIVDQVGRVRWVLHNAMSEPRDIGEYLRVLAEMAA